VPVVLYGCETWSLISREEPRLRVIESRVLGRIFGPKRDEVTGQWRKLHNWELKNPSHSKKIQNDHIQHKNRSNGNVLELHTEGQNCDKQQYH